MDTMDTKEEHLGLLVPSRILLEGAGADSVRTALCFVSFVSFVVRGWFE
jgi:hypothetical protein